MQPHFLLHNLYFVLQHVLQHVFMSALHHCSVPCGIALIALSSTHAQM